MDFPDIKRAIVLTCGDGITTQLQKQLISLKTVYLWQFHVTPPATSDQKSSGAVIVAAVVTWWRYVDIDNILNTRLDQSLYKGNLDFFPVFSYSLLSLVLQ